jgi:hypothetical protein
VLTALLLGGILLLMILQGLEIRRRVRDPETLTARQYRRRLITAGILQLALVMWLVGEPLMRHQPPLVQLAYWSAVLLLPPAAAFAALWDRMELLRQYNRQRAALFRGGDEGVSESSSGAIGRRTNGGDRASG